MNIIKDGAVSGVIPDKQIFTIEYPGYVKSPQLALETLGGKEAIAKAVSSEHSFMELRYRPSDPYSHPLFGERQEKCNLVLRLSRKRKRTAAANVDRGALAGPAAALPDVSSTSRVDSLGQQTNGRPGWQLASTSVGLSEGPSPVIARDGTGADESSKEISSLASVRDEGELRAEVIGLVDCSYQFEGMADFQYMVGVHVAAEEKAGKKHLQGDGKQDDTTQAMPGGMAASTAQDVQAGLQPGTAEGVPGDEQHKRAEWTNDGHPRLLVPALFTKRDMPDLHLLRMIDIKNDRSKVKPKVPSHVTTEEKEREYLIYCGLDFQVKDVPPQREVDDLEAGTEEQRYFDELKVYFESRPVWSRNALAELLREKISPFNENLMKRMLMRQAYYFANGPYRTLWIRNGFDVRNTPSSCIFQLLDFRMPAKWYTPQFEPDVRASWRDICQFRVLPDRRSVFVQLCDLADDSIQQDIAKGPQLSSCNAITGWFRRESLETFRNTMRVRFYHLLPEADREPSALAAAHSYSQSAAASGEGPAAGTESAGITEAYGRGQNEEGQLESDNEAQGTQNLLASSAALVQLASGGQFSSEPAWQAQRDGLEQEGGARLSQSLGGLDGGGREERTQTELTLGINEERGILAEEALTAGQGQEKDQEDAVPIGGEEVVDEDDDEEDEEEEDEEEEEEEDEEEDEDDVEEEEEEEEELPLDDDTFANVQEAIPLEYLQALMGQLEQQPSHFSGTKLGDSSLQAFAEEEAYDIFEQEDEDEEVD